MIRGTAGHVAHQFETVAGIITRPLYSNKNLYIIDGAPGVWRQVADPGVSDFAHLGIVAAAFGRGKIFLTYDVATNAELALAGFCSTVADAAVPPDLFDAIAKGKELAAKQPPTLLTAATGTNNGATATAAGSPPVAPKPRRRAAGSVVTSSTAPALAPIPPEADGSPAAGSLAAEFNLNARPESPAPTPTEAPKTPDGDAAGVDDDSGFAPPDLEM